MIAFFSRWRKQLIVLFYLILFASCAFAIHAAFRGHHVSEIGAGLTAIGWGRALIALSMVATTYLTMCVIERFALIDAGLKLKLKTIAFGACVANSMSIGVGLGAVSGAAIRARLFSAWGADPAASAIAGMSVTVISIAGGVALASLGLACNPEPIAAALHQSAAYVRYAGLGLIAVGIVILIVMGRRPRTLAIRQLSLRVPHALGALARLGAGILDWLFSASVLYALLPAHATGGLLAFAALFAAVHMVSMMTGAPAGIGVFDAVMLSIAPGGMPPGDLAAALIIYRLMAQVLPLALGVAAFALFEMLLRHRTAHANATARPKDGAAGG
jgi:uncharacterized membrane protein YbhN (UPF0104 family)